MPALFTNCATVLLSLFILLSPGKISAQKPSAVTRSTVTGIRLPDGSREDKRSLMTLSANMLLKDVAEKNNVGIQTTEVLYTPLQFTPDSFTTAAVAAGWTVTADPATQNTFWLQQNNRYVVAMHAKRKNQAELYIAVCTQLPPSVVSNTPPPVVNKTPAQQQKENIQPGTVTSQPAINTGFAFSTTNFDDGWTSTVQENWVEVTKGNIRVLLHYPREEEKKYISQHDERTRFFWDLIVAPRYTSLANFELLNYNYSSEPAYYAAGDVTEPSGNKVYVTLFSKARSGWIEVITPDKNTFVNTFNISKPDAYFSDWEPLSHLASYNKFAVGANDLVGKWTTQFTSSMALYNVYTGIYAGASNYASAQSFSFSGNKKYHWKLATMKGNAAGTNTERTESDGVWQLSGNWLLSCSDIGKFAKKYNVYFSCIKGARILHMEDTGYPGYTSFGKAAD